MVEETHLCEAHYHAVFICALDNEVVSYGSAGLCDVLNAGLLCSLDVV